jgi:hypothetical protein
MIAEVRWAEFLALRSGIPLFGLDMIENARGSLQGDGGNRLAQVQAQGGNQIRDGRTRTGELVGAAPDGISSAGWRVATSHWAASKSPTRKPSMTANAVRFAAGLALVAVAAPLPATAQYFPPALIIVPPQAQQYATPKAAPKPPPDKPKAPTDTPPAGRPAGHYQGQTFVPD